MGVNDETRRSPSELPAAGARVERWSGPPPSEETLRARMVRAGLQPGEWGNAPGDRYGRHSHGYRKVLYCARGSIVFHTPDGDVELRAGDRLDLDPGVEHAATVGPEGVRCLEAHA